MTNNNTTGSSSKRTARKGGWRVIKTLTAEQTQAARAQLLRSAAESHAEIGEHRWAEEYARRADAIDPKKVTL